MSEFDPNSPIVLGLAGAAATGKTSAANILAPQTKIQFMGQDNEVPSIVWSHLFFALPIYEMATARNNIEGAYARDRMRYSIHSTLVDLFGSSPLFGAPSYTELVGMVEEIATLPFPLDGSKPRSFLQRVGTEICRGWDENCFVKHMSRKIGSEYYRLEKEVEDLDNPPFIGVVVSDVRFPNEADFIANNRNGILIKLECDDDVRKARQEARDGFLMSEDHDSHASESSVDLIDPSLYTAVIDTTDLSIKEQVNQINRVVEQYTGAILNA